MRSSSISAGLLWSILGEFFRESFWMLGSSSYTLVITDLEQRLCKMPTRTSSAFTCTINCVALCAASGRGNEFKTGSSEGSTTSRSTSTVAAIEGGGIGSMFFMIPAHKTWRVTSWSSVVSLAFPLAFSVGTPPL